MGTMKKIAIILFKLPDGKLVLQRRTKDASYGAGLLGIFGGWVEDGETVDQGIIREIKEETSLDTDALGIKALADFVIPAGEDLIEARHFYLYVGNVDSLDFEVYEGEGAEAYTLSEIKNRTDLTVSAKYTFSKILNANTDIGRPLAP